MTQHDQPAPDLATLAAIGLFAERRISRGAATSGEREASDAVMTAIAAADLSSVTLPQPGELLAASAAPRLPEDALERLKGVKGIGDDLAQKALDALTQ